MRNDSLGEIASFYDSIMSHVDYERWAMVTTTIADIFPAPFLHVDAACGTCKLGKALKRYGWRTHGVDLSYDMLQVGRKGRAKPSVAQADLRNLPFKGSVDYMTCLFDSMNFILDLDGFQKAVASCAKALRPGGVLYFDIVTEQMVLQHYADQSWTERHRGLNTTWRGEYDRGTRVAKTFVTVKNGPACCIQERMYSLEEVREAIELAGLDLLGAYDAEGWQKPSKHSVRLDFVACKGEVQSRKRAFTKSVANIRAVMGAPAD